MRLTEPQVYLNNSKAVSIIFGCTIKTQITNKLTSDAFILLPKSGDLLAECNRIKK